jgi:dihydroorotate dehydrogenase electron transfer subunit
MRMHKIEKVVEEYKGNKTIYLGDYILCVPGQFAMVWLPGVDEKPFSIMNWDGRTALNVEVKGKWSKAAYALKKGAKIGIRGPFGNGFDVKGVKNALLVGGGVGAAPLMPLLGLAKKKKIKTDFLLAARTKERLLFVPEIKKNADELYITTDDGSAGKKGFATDMLQEIFRKKKYDMVYVCGPEIMMKKVHELCIKHKIKSQLSLERFMKCGFGVCGECMVDDKILCVDGPVLKGEELAKSTEFGKTAYLKSGKKVPIKEFYEWKQK